MRALSLGVLLVVLSGCALGCQRELPYQTSPEQPIVGYRIEGYVIDHLGVPLKGVRVGVWYDYEFVDTLRPPSSTFFVDDSTKNVLVRVLDHNQKVRAILLEGHSPVGPLEVEWGKRDSYGNLVPSGVYTVDFSQNGVHKASYTVLVDGAVTTVTDSLGYYAILDENLPIGFYPAPRYSSYDSQFTGNYSITSSITLELYLDIHRGTSVPVTKDQITRHDFVI
ncbi:MAG: hypothetical protein NTZ35_03580 [Ignavibacteriales bacterium]|nr:hypothetical protein [Ignavibacteriales bacterium]